MQSSGFRATFSAFCSNRTSTCTTKHPTLVFPSNSDFCIALVNVWIWLGSVGQGCFYVVLRSKKSRGSLLELPLSCNTVGNGIGATIPLSGQTVGLYKRIIQRPKQENVIRDFQIFVGQLVYGSMTKSKPPNVPIMRCSKKPKKHVPATA